MSAVYDFFKCEKCGKELKNTSEQKPVVDRQGFTRIYCVECFKTASR